MGSIDQFNCPFLFFYYFIWKEVICLATFAGCDFTFNSVSSTLRAYGLLELKVD
jgi:hypothetical protein